MTAEIAYWLPLSMYYDDEYTHVGCRKSLLTYDVVKPSGSWLA